MKKIVLDVCGGDNPSSEFVKGAIAAVNADSAIRVVLVGKQAEIEAELSNHAYNADQIQIVDAPDVITNYDVPTEAIKRKKDSSMVRAFEVLKTDDEACALVSSGSTGAYLTGSIFKVGRIKNVPRPALAPLLPTMTGGNVLLIDSGANVDSKPHFLAGFAVMGSAYMRALFGIERPRVALVSNGVEDKKGNELTHAAFKLLSELPDINFVGNMEARDALSGDFDVLVCDGFVGNVLLKSVEGASKLLLTLLKDSIMSSASAKFGYLFMKKAFGNMKAKVDYNKLGGAPFLGVEKLVIKSHGSSKATAIQSTIAQAAALADKDVIGHIKADIAKTVFTAE